MKIYIVMYKRGNEEDIDKIFASKKEARNYVTDMAIPRLHIVKRKLDEYKVG